MAEVSYCTREQVQDTLQLADSLRLNARIDAAVRTASRDIEGLCHRYFYPTDDTLTFDQPPGLSLFLNESELSSVPTLVTSGSITMTTADYILQPVQGPPYTWIDVDQAGTNFWTSDETTQRAVSITGTFGYPVTQALATTTTGAGINSAAPSVTIADSSQVGVGQLCLIDAERVIVTGKLPVSTTATLTAPIGANKAEVTLALSGSGLVFPGERVRVDAEWMIVNDVAGATAYVTRAAAGSVLAAHSAAAVVYAPRQLAIARGQLGTVSTSHLTGAPVYNLLPPSLVTEYAVALAEVIVSQGASGYARPVGGGTGGTSGNQRDPTGVGIENLADRVYQRYGRKARMRTPGFTVGF